jgi:hypothetical protein
LKNIYLPEEIGNSIDWYLYIMLSNKNDVLLVNKKLLFYRVHSESTGNSNIVAHTENCKKLFIYLKEKEFKSDVEIIKIIDLNIAEFNKVIIGNQSKSIKYFLQKINYFITKIFFKIYKHPQFKR